MTVRGLGRASRIVARKSETAFLFEGCRSVVLNDLAVASLEPTTRDGLGGAIQILNSGPATVERVTVITPSAPEPVASGIAVVRGPDSRASGPTRIHDCDLTTGEQQTGILVVNADVVQIEGNTLQAGVFPEGTSLGEYLKNARYRAAAARQLVDPNPPPDRELTAVDTGPATTGEFDTIRFAVGTGTDRAGVTFRSTMRSGDVWRSLLAADASTPTEAITRAREIADTVLRNEGTFESRTSFRTWYQEVEARWQVQPLGDRASSSPGLGPTTSGSSAMS